jgi:hypothetical protein
MNNAPLGLVKAYGEGYITRKDGTIQHFTISTEGNVDGTDTGDHDAGRDCGRGGCDRRDERNA